MGQTIDETFISWLQGAVANDTVVIGAHDSPVHLDRGGLFLESPAVFKMYMPNRWLDAQHEFLSLGLHARCPVEKGSFHGRHLNATKHGTLSVRVHKVGVVIPFHNLEKVLPNLPAHLVRNEVPQWA